MTSDTSEANDAIARAREEFRARNSAAVENTRKRIMEFRRQAVVAFEKTKKERENTITKAAERLNTTVDEVQKRHEVVRRRLSQEAIRRDVHVRVNRSLGALEDFIRETRGSAMDEEKMLAAIGDPAISGTIQDKQRRMSVSDLMLSVQKQLIQQSEFINVAAHELRTPIMPILTYAEILESSMAGKSEEIEAIKRNALRLQRLAENILNVARIDSNTLVLRKQTFDLNIFVDEIVREKSLSRAVKLRFVPYPEKVEVSADKERITQVISNLLENAMKFTSTVGIVVSIKRVEQNALIQVADNGPGIDPALFPVLFTKFGARSQGGTGLGLFICKGIVEAHGGRITARNKEEYGKSGAVFEFTLPIDPSTTVPAGS
ncbi:MAG: HAMP domain-containing histidine kinase [Thaumarchaeota archaeon]|nr:HAMP domain-containing histidine kinase [Nitrososphaerota archaeon]